jgi:hypothetical protein
MFYYLIFFNECINSQSLNKLCFFTLNQNDCIVNGFDKLTDLRITCGKFKYPRSLVIMPNLRLDMEHNFKLTTNGCLINGLALNNFKSITFKSQLITENDISTIKFFNSEFNYINDFDEINRKSQKRIKEVYFENDMVYHFDVSPLIFNETDIQGVSFNNLIDSKLKKNYFTFEQLVSYEQYNSSILFLELNVFKVRITKNILDEKVFKKVEIIVFNNFLEYIDQWVVDKLQNLKSITFSLYSLKRFFSSGFKWAKNFNSHKIQSNVSLNKKRVSIEFINMFVIQRNIKIERYTYPNEDFCLFKYFPHENYVYPKIEGCFSTCTYYWLTKNYKLYKIPDFNCKYSKPTDCDFDFLLALCDTKTWDYNILDTSDTNDYYYLYDEMYKMKQYDYMLSVIIFPIICFLGILFNLLNIRVLTAKKFKREFRENMYRQMLINSIVNLLICIIYMFRLTIKCIDPIENYCPSSLISNKTIRIFFLTFINYFGNVLKTLSNLISIFISVDRLIISTDSRYFILKIIKKFDAKWVYILFFLFSLAINIIKIFQFDYEIDYNQFTFPIMNKDFYNIQKWYSYLNFVSIFFNNFCVIIVQISIDSVLFTLIKKSFKQNKISMITKNHNMKKDEKVERNIRIMIISSTFFLFILHVPDFVNSVYMASLYASPHTIIQPLNVIVTKDNERVIDAHSIYLFSYILSITADVIYFIGYSLNTLFYYCFNTHFRKSLDSIFNPYKNFYKKLLDFSK